MSTMRHLRLTSQPTSRLWPDPPRFPLAIFARSPATSLLTRTPSLESDSPRQRSSSSSERRLNRDSRRTHNFIKVSKRDRPTENYSPSPSLLVSNFGPLNLKQYELSNWRSIGQVVLRGLGARPELLRLRAPRSAKSGKTMIFLISTPKLQNKLHESRGG